MDYLGKQILIELYGCNESLINDKQYIENIMLKAAEVGNATIVGSNFHRFNPYGVSGVVVIAESHLSIHTWIEYKYVALDVFTCSDKIDTNKMVKFLIDSIENERHEIKEIKRGKC